MTIDDITIDPEFKAFLPPLSSDAYTALQVEILRDGCNDPLTVWEEEGVLIDGHHRLDICNANDVECDCSTVSLPNRDEAKRWMLHHARARRNSTPDELSYMRGVEYNLEKKEPHRPKADKKGGQTCPLKTAQKLADAHGVSERTIKRDGKYAEAVDTIAKNVRPEAKRTLLSGDSTVTKSKVAAIAKLPAKKQVAAVKAMTGGKAKKAANKAAKAKPTAKAKKKAFELYNDCDTPFHQMLERVKSLGERVPKETFHKAIGGEANEAFFMSHINEINYMHLQEDEDGTCGLFIDDSERDLCTAIEAQLQRMKDAAGKGNRFKFNLPRLRAVIQDMYELVRKASTHA